MLAFNVITLEHAGASCPAPSAPADAAILQISQNAVRYPRRPGARSRPRRAPWPRRPACRWPCTSTTSRTRPCCTSAADDGFTSVMFDAGALAYAANVDATRGGGRLGARRAGCGWRPSSATSAASPTRRAARTRPACAPTRTRRRAFVADTGVDALAVAVGSSHAMTDAHRRARPGPDRPAARRRAGAAGAARLVRRARRRAARPRSRTASSRSTSARRSTSRSPAAVRGGARHDAVDPRRYLAAARDAVGRRGGASAGCCSAAGDQTCRTSIPSVAERRDELRSAPPCR